MKKIIFKAAFNGLSFGNVSYNVARELYKKDIQASIFPIGDNFDFSAFDKLDEDFRKWLESAANNRLTSIKKDTPCLTIWHVNGSESRISQNNTLYSFYELSSPTLTEKNLVDFQDNTIFSSSYARKAFEQVNCENVHDVPLGFDIDFFETKKTYLEGKIHFGLMGKWEKRKHTADIIKLWASKYGNNPDYQLTCCVVNPFFKDEQMNQIIGQTLQGQQYGNINFLPRLKTNSEVNEFHNAIDIDLSGMSGAEGWNLPAFNASALGKWSIVLNSSSHLDWATKDNCILLEPKGTTSAEDGVFFTKNNPFNQGEIHTFDHDEFVSCMEKSENYVGKYNKNGVKLKEDFSYEKTVDSILDIMEKNA
tara:strand:- start:337 stop:1428 length:1092 start_codon:yes stop_codon:yes gene_type:complete